MFLPAPDVVDWMQHAFLSEQSDLFNEDHIHLQDAEIGVLWAYGENLKHSRRIIGTAEIPRLQSGWKGQRKEEQLSSWFGMVPEFVITLEVSFWRGADNPSRCALIEHEMYHCGHAHDMFGMPKFSRLTGRPIYTMVAHDVEEFIGVVRRYGAKASGVEELVRTANKGAEIATATIEGVCGRCGKKVA